MLYLYYNNDVLEVNVKYWREYKNSSGVIEHVCSDIEDLPVGKPIWAVAYDINNENLYPRLKKKPVLGEIFRARWGFLFVEYKKDGKTLRESGEVNFESRVYADTEKEAIEMYNTLVQDKINLLYKIIEDAEDDKI